MIYKRCNICHKRLPIGTKCSCYERKRKADVLNVNSFYNTSEWKHSRDKAIARYYGLDIYSLLVLHKIEYGYTVHHIVPLEIDYSLRNSQDNLIYLTESNHRLIHEQLKKDYHGTIEFLHDLISQFFYIFLGEAKNVFL